MSIKDVLADWQAQMDRARDRIRMFEAGEMGVHDTFAPHQDWTLEAIAIECQIIASLEAGIEILRKMDAPRP
jgi:hypothetical protein